MEIPPVSHTHLWGPSAKDPASDIINAMNRIVGDAEKYLKTHDRSLATEMKSLVAQIKQNCDHLSGEQRTICTELAKTLDVLMQPFLAYPDESTVSAFRTLQTLFTQFLQPH